ncbi:MAG: hypothetical protein DRJ40_06840 [Thermoprotei archaeon]|nr:MAG: hypothetical protein DRJ40_06840 [Thermoprotei archaeon]
MRVTFRDRDFIESVEGYIFCVIGNVHPPDRVICYLKYVPGVESKIRIKWSRDGKMYGRVLPFYSAIGFSTVMDFLRKNCPEYVVYDEVLGVEVIEVPRSRVKVHYLPEERLREILKEPRDELEALAKELVEELSRFSGVSTTYMGITGSILLRIHNVKYSDVDIIVYGRENALKVKETLLQLYDDPKSPFKRPRGEVLEAWVQDIIKIHPLTPNEARRLYGSEKWNRALYRGRQFSVHPVKLEHEVREKYGDERYIGEGLIKIRAVVEDDSESIFLPAKYVVRNVRILEGPKVSNIREVVCYEGLYCDLAKPGEEIEVFGRLEKVIKSSGEVYRRVTVGSVDAGGKDYLKPIRWFST